MNPLRPLKSYVKWLGDRRGMRRKIVNAQERLAIHQDLGTLKEIPVKGFRKMDYYAQRLADLEAFRKARAEMTRQLLPASKYLSEYVPNAAGSEVQSHRMSLHGTIASLIGRHPESGQTQPLPFVTLHEGRKRIGKA